MHYRNHTLWVFFAFAASIALNSFTFAEGLARDENRPCFIRICSTETEFIGLDEGETTLAESRYNMTCGRSGEVLDKLVVNFGKLSETGSCKSDGSGISSDTEFKFEEACQAPEADLKELQAQVENACDKKSECGSIDGDKFSEFIQAKSDELADNAGPGCEDAKIVITSQCSRPGFDTLAVLPLFMTAFIGLGLGSSLTRENFIRIWVTHKLPFIIGIVSQFLFMPLIAYIFATGFNFPDATGVGLIVAGSCPGGATSNLFTYWSKGDVALSITMSGASTMVALFMMPLLILMYINTTYEESASIPFGDIVITLVVAVLPAILGVVIRDKNEKVAAVLEKAASVIGILFLLAVLAIGIMDNPDLFDAGLYPWTWTVCMFYQPLGTAFGYGAATATKFAGEKWRILRADKRAIAMECGVQSYGIAVALISISFRGCQRNATLVPVYIATIAYVINSAWIVPMFRFYSRYDPVEEVEALEKEEHNYEEKRKSMKENAVAPIGTN